jgi:peptidoglycan/LPS O-acetylase OafA/YrhL
MYTPVDTQAKQHSALTQKGGRTNTMGAARALSMDILTVPKLLPESTSIKNLFTYRREIDGLRALAVIPVILFHAGFQAFSGGFIGVDVFFVISGYLITSIILSEKQAGTFTLVGFYERRARRILPALFVVLLACIPFAWYLMLPSEMKEFSESLIAVSTFLSNVFFWKQSGYFDAATALKPLLHTWSLAVEEQYYVLFPIFLLLAWRLGKRWVVILLSAIAMMGLSLAEWGSYTFPAASIFLLPTRGWEILVGACVALFLFTRDGARKIDQLAGHPVSQSISLIGFALIAYAVCAFDKHTPFPGLYTLMPTIGAALIIVFATQQTLVGKFLGSKLFVGIGLISYSAYLWHQPLYAFARLRSADEPSKFLFAVLAAVAIVLAYFSWKYVETPIRNRQGINRKQVCVYGALCTVAFMAFGVLGSITDGFSYRYTQSDRHLAELQFSHAGKYVKKRFDELRMKDFDPSDNRIKVLIVGDSHAQDLVNALYEAGFTARIQLSTRHIDKNCGNLFLERSSFISKVDKAGLRSCNNTGLFEDEKFRTLMLEADEIWFNSSWQYWQAELLPRSVDNVKSFVGKNITVRVFGGKTFGNYRIKDLLSKSEDERYAIKSRISQENIETNALMGRTLSSGVFVDVQRLLCGEDAHVCSLFSLSHELISHDGGHLTVDGAKYLGDRLSQHPSLNHFVSQ